MNARADALKDQFVMDMHTHFLRDDTRIGPTFAPIASRRAWSRAFTGPLPSAVRT